MHMCPVTQLQRYYTPAVGGMHTRHQATAAPHIFLHLFKSQQ